MYTWVLNSHSFEHCDLGSLENVVPDVCHRLSEEGKKHVSYSSTVLKIEHVGYLLCMA